MYDYLILKKVINQPQKIQKHYLMFFFFLKPNQLNKIVIIKVLIFLNI